jgi:hypothetical protein
MGNENMTQQQTTKIKNKYKYISADDTMSIRLLNLNQYNHQKLTEEEINIIDYYELNENNKKPINMGAFYKVN